MADHTQLRLEVASFFPDADGSVWFACGKGAFGNTEWRGFGRLDLATGKHTVRECDFYGPLARFGGGLLGRSASSSTQLVVVDPDSGAELKRAALPAALEGLRVHPDGTSALIDCDGKLFLVGEALALTPIHTVLAVPHVHGAGFDADGNLLASVLPSASAQHAALVRRAGGKKAQVLAASLSHPVVGLFDVRGDVILTGYSRLFHTDGTDEDLGTGRGFWANDEGTDLVVAPFDGTLQLRTGTSKVRKKLKWRRGQATDAFVRDGAFVISNGDWVDVFQLRKPAAKKKPAKQKR